MDTRISDKLARSGKVLDIFSKVLAVICVLGAASTLLVAVIIAFWWPLNIVMNIHAMSPSTFDSAIVPNLKIFGIMSALGLCLYCVLCAIVLLTLSAVFKAIAVQKTPFLPENVKRLKVIGIIMIIASLTVGMLNIIFAFCVFALAYVFQYGTELQQQVDETL